MSLPSGAAALVALIALTACRGGPEPAPSGPNETELASAAMDSVYARFTRAYALGVPDSVVALYTDAPLYLPAGAPGVLEGRAALREQFAFLAGLREAGRTPRISFESVQRGASGDLAYDVGYYTLRVQTPDGGTGPGSRGKFTTIWHRGADGYWRIHVDSFSPAGGPETEGS